MILIANLKLSIDLKSSQCTYLSSLLKFQLCRRRIGRWFTPENERSNKSISRALTKSPKSGFAIKSNWFLCVGKKKAAAAKERAARPGTSFAPIMISQASDFFSEALVKVPQRPLNASSQAETWQMKPQFRPMADTSSPKWIWISRQIQIRAENLNLKMEKVVAELRAFNPPSARQTSTHTDTHGGGGGIIYTLNASLSSCCAAQFRRPRETRTAFNEFFVSVTFSEKRSNERRQQPGRWFAR